MADAPKRKKLKHPASDRSARIRRKSVDPALGSFSGLDLRTLIVLSVGEWWELAEYDNPPESVYRWIEKADFRELRGALLAILARWHELSRR
ncbi:MAG TPA: hypothetical protein VHE81_04195 [Lacipirellulaceae bacterium]|nr:hypothetical protein [Lacipirellulaceae bacterium]